MQMPILASPEGRGCSHMLPSGVSSSALPCPVAAISVAGGHCPAVLAWVSVGSGLGHGMGGGLCWG